MDGYDERFESVREQWLHGYFNWTDAKDIAEAERHTARDGFDAGANWATKNAAKAAAMSGWCFKNIKADVERCLVSLREERFHLAAMRGKVGKGIEFDIKSMEDILAVMARRPEAQDTTKENQIEH